MHPSVPYSTPSGSPCLAARCTRAASGSLPARRAEPGSRLCSRCRRALLRDLAALPGLHRDSEQFLAAGHGTGPTERVTGSRADTLPVRSRAVDARHTAVTRLSAWCRLLTGLSTAGGDRTVTGLATLLADRSGELLHRPDAGRLADEVAAAAAALRRLGTAERAALVPLGRCVEPGCEAEVTMPRRGGEGTVLRGPSCAAGHVLSPRQWLALKAAA